MDQAITIRRSAEGDREAIRRLAELDSRRASEGDFLLAFVHGELRAALPLEDGARPIADPFAATADLVELLSLQVGHEIGSRRRLDGFLGRRNRAAASRASEAVA